MLVQFSNATETVFIIWEPGEFLRNKPKRRLEKVFLIFVMFAFVLPGFVFQRNKTWTMSSVAVLTPESFAEHRSGLKEQEIPGKIHLSPVSS